MQATDIQIAREARLEPIALIGQRLGIPETALLPYGHDKAKIDYAFIASQQDKARGEINFSHRGFTNPCRGGQDHDHHRTG